MKHKLLDDFGTITKDLLETLNLFTPEEFNKLPFEGSWTAGQVAEHMLKSEPIIVSSLKGASEATQRDALQHIAMIERVFLDFNIRLQSPEFIIPSDKPKDKNKLIKNFEESRKELKHALDTLNLNRSFIEFDFPTVGYLTGWESICFINCHTKRHIHQMKNIFQKLKNLRLPMLYEIGTT